MPGVVIPGGPAGETVSVTMLTVLYADFLRWLCGRGLVAVRAVADDGLPTFEVARPELLTREARPDDPVTGDVFQAVLPLDLFEPFKQWLASRGLIAALMPPEVGVRADPPSYVVHPTESLLAEWLPRDAPDEP